MRILIVTPYYKPAYVYGGPVQCISGLAEGLAQAGNQVAVFTTNANIGAAPHVPNKEGTDVDGVRVWYFPLVLKRLRFFYSPAFARAVNARIPEFDMVHASTLWEYMLVPTGNACRRAGVPYIIAVHGQLFPWALARKKLKKNLYLTLVGRRYIDRAAAIHCTDAVEFEAVVRYRFKSPAFVVPYGIDTSNFLGRTRQGSLRKRFGIADDALVVMLLGRISRIKRPDVAVDVLAAAQSLNKDVHLVIVGPDEDGLVPGLESQARALACRDKLHFTGLMEKANVADALSDADLLLMPSEIQENFGMSALEAMAAGVPILVSEGIPVGRWAHAAGAGRVACCTQDDFTQAALDLLSSRERLAAIGRRGKDLARNYFDSRAVAHSMSEQYRAIIATGRPLAGSPPDDRPGGSLTSFGFSEGAG